MSRLQTLTLRIPRTILIALLRTYQWGLSPVFLPSCRYVPTCSDYAIEAVERYGAFRGSVMAVWRLLRCLPFVPGGFDPVADNTAHMKTGAAIRTTAGSGCPHTSPASH